MAQSFDAGIDTDVATSQLMDLRADVMKFKGLVQQEVDEAIKETATEFRDAVQDEIKKSDIESDTGELMNSWKVRPKGLAEYEVRSTADHAVFLELGTRPHTISANGGGWLKFQVESAGQYPRREFEEVDGEVTGDYAEEVLVVSPLDPLADAEPGTYFAKSVQHPGNEAYGYFQNAYDRKPWEAILATRVRSAMGQAAEKSGL